MAATASDCPHNAASCPNGRACSSAGGHLLRARTWTFTLFADEDKGQHLEWMAASVRDPPLHWADLAHFKYMMYQVSSTFLNIMFLMTSLKG